jgi:hypothetical protein
MHNQDLNLSLALETVSQFFSARRKAAMPGMRALHKQADHEIKRSDPD